MDSIRNAKQTVVLVAMLGVFSSAVAQERFYGGAGIGMTKTPISQNALSITGATASTLSRNDIGTGGKLFGGYQANPNFAVEAGYVDLGKISATRNMTSPSVGSVAQSTRNTGWFVDLVGSMPIGASEFSVIGKVGRIASDTSKSLAFGGTVTPVAGAASTYRDSESNWKYGAGAQYEISKTMAARGEFELYRKLGREGSAGENEVGLFSVNLLIKFH
jgi:OOP family OmpA-OmpF porin